MKTRKARSTKVRKKRTNKEVAEDWGGPRNLEEAMGKKLFLETIDLWERYIKDNPELGLSEVTMPKPPKVVFEGLLEKGKHMKEDFIKIWHTNTELPEDIRHLYKRVIVIEA